MLIVGTGGFAADLLTSLTIEFRDDEMTFYNDTDIPDPDFIKNGFTVIKNDTEVANYFRTSDNRFLVAVGDNHERERLAKKFTALGGTNKSFISKHAYFGKATKIAPTGVIIMHDVGISWDAHIDEGTLIYSACAIGHGSRIGKYCFMSAGVIMSKTILGDYCSVNIGVRFKPGNSLGANSFVGIGSVVTKSFPENSNIRGYPAR